LGGLPDAATATNSLTLLAGPVGPAIVNFFNFLVANCAIQSNDRSNANPFQLCSAFNAATQVFTFAVAHGFLSGQTIVAGGWKMQIGGSVPKGRYIANVIDNLNIKIDQKGPGSGPAITLGGFRALSYTFPSLFLIINRGVTKRNVGRPFGSAVGRARTVTRPRA